MPYLLEMLEAGAPDDLDFIVGIGIGFVGEAELVLGEIGQVEVEVPLRDVDVFDAIATCILSEAVLIPLLPGSKQFN